MSSPGADAKTTAAGKSAAVLFGCRGLTLSAEEAAFFADVNPFGFILFSRNIDNPDQVRALVAGLRDCVGRGDAPVLIDQEGGRVQRLRPPHWRQAPAAAEIAAIGPKAGEAAFLNARLIGRELAELGITVDCAPVLDVARSETHSVIGDRAYSGDPATVAMFGRAVADGLRAEGVHPVIKHIPGHGRASADSHLELPRVAASYADLQALDFAPFRALNCEDWAMTAHIVYDAIDPEAPATCSRAMIEGIVRGEIGFDGLLMSDDLSMKALAGDFDDRARAALEAGCDMVLHCNGDMDEMKSVAKGVGALSDKALERFSAAEARRIKARADAEPVATAELAARFAALMG